MVHKLPERNKDMLELLIKHLVTYVFPSWIGYTAAFKKKKRDDKNR